MRIAHFKQHHADSLPLDKSPLQLFQEEKEKDQEARNHLGAFGICGKQVFQKIGTLSGGEKSRVSFALLTRHKPHLLLFDEPSNHLAKDIQDALIATLREFEGPVVVVSHDQSFMEQVANEFWSIGDKGEVRMFYDYQEAINFTNKG